MRGGGGQKMSVFVHAQGMKTVHAGGGVKKWQNSVHIVVEWPLLAKNISKHKHDLNYQFQMGSFETACFINSVWDYKKLLIRYNT